MSTRSAIITKTDTGYAGIYCHFDGYLDGVGKTLLEHYKTQEKVNQLIALGDISTLGPEIGEAHDFDNRDGKQTTAYMRDRGETGCEQRQGETINDVEKGIGHNGYVYVFEDGKWTVNGEDLATAKESED